MSGGARVSIPGSVRKTIQNIKEIAGNHTDEEVYAMLKECAMDPNETAQKLLLLDTFHEVKRKRDKRKENRETVDSRGRLEPQGRGARGGRGIYSSRYVSYDSGGGSDVGVGKENSANQGADKHNRSPPSPATHDAENKSTVPMSSFVAGPANGFPNVEDAISGNRCASQVSDFTGNTVVEEWSAAKINKAETQPPGDVKRCSASGQFMPKSCQLSSSMTPKSVSGVYASALDTVLLPSLDACNPGAVGAIGHEVGSQRTSAGTSSSGVVSHESATSELSSVSEKSSIEAKNSYMQAKVQSKSQGFEIHQFSAQDASSTSLTAATGCRPSSVCKNRLQQLSGPPKAAGPTMEWKPKAASVNAAQCSEAQGMSETEPVSSETVASSPAASSSTYSEDTSLKLHKLLEPLHISDTQHVIIPNHLQVPESQRIGLTFGSFDANFGLSTAFATAPDSDESSTQLSESYQEVEENVEELSQRIPNASTTVQEAGYPDHLQPPARLPASVSAGEPIPAASENDQLKPEAAIALQGPPHSVIHAAPNLSTFGRVTQVLGSQFATTESTEPQPQDSLHLSSFLVQQQLDPSTSYYTQIYRPAADGDGRFSPFLLPSTPSKYNGNISVIPAQTSQCPQEIGNSPFPSSTVLAPLVTQAAGVMQTSFSVSQQSVPVYRQPAGVHMSHYPPNFIPYSQYFSPFFVPPPTIHHFLSNTGFPQQLPTRSIYPPPAAAAAVNPVKYSPTQYKPPTSNVNTTHLGMPAGFGTYNSTPTGYCPNPIVSSGNSTRNEDSASQYEENNVYATAQQQNEAPAVWISAPGRDISSLQASSFYGLPPQGQQLTFAPAQAGHGAFTGIYHPNQSVAAGSVHPLLQQSQAMAGAVEVVGPPSGVYQQPQLPQELRQTSCSGIVLGRGPADLEFTQDPESLLMCPHCSLPESSANQNVWSCVVTKDNHVPILPLHPHPIS